MYIEVTPTTPFIELFGIIDGNGIDGGYADGMTLEFQFEYLDGNYNPIFTLPEQDKHYDTFGSEYDPWRVAEDLQKIIFDKSALVSMFSFEERGLGYLETTVLEELDYYFDGNLTLVTSIFSLNTSGDGTIEFVDGNAPSDTVYPSIVHNGNTVHLSQVEELGTWTLGDHNIFRLSGMVQAYHKVNLKQGIVIFHGNNNSGTSLPLKCNIAFANQYKNYNILAQPNPPLIAIPRTLSTVEPWYAGISQYEMEACTMLKNSGVFKTSLGDYYIEESNETIAAGLVLAGTHPRLMALDSAKIYTYTQKKTTGEPFGRLLPEFVIYEHAAVYTSVMSQDDVRLKDIPYAIYDSYIELDRTEGVLKGPVNVQGTYYWCTLDYITEVDSPFVGKYVFRDKITIDDIDMITMKSLQVMTAFNKIKTD